MTQRLYKINRQHNEIGSSPNSNLDINEPKVQQILKQKEVAWTKWSVYTKQWPEMVVEVVKCFSQRSTSCTIIDHGQNG